MVSRSRRSRLEVTMELLETITKDPVPSRIVDKMGINYKLLHKHLPVLKNAGLIEEKKGIIRKWYSITEKGERVLNLWQVFQFLLEPI